MTLQITKAVALGIRRALAADSTMAAFFGADGIVTMSDEETRYADFRRPTLVVVPGDFTPGYRSADRARLRLRTSLRIYAPLSTPCRPELTRATKPTVAEGDAGALTGTFRYVATRTYDTGESLAFAPEIDLPGRVAVDNVGVKTVAAKTVTVNTGGNACRLWRTRNGGSCYFYLATLPTGGSFTDNVLDDALGAEIAPEPLLREELLQAAMVALFVAGEMKVGADDASSVTANNAVPTDVPEQVLTDRNLVLSQLIIDYGTLIAPQTGEPKVSGDVVSEE